jgi:hypothetical protein
MPGTGLTGDLFDDLPLPIVSTDYKPIIRGTQTFKTPAIDVPTLFAVANDANGQQFRGAFTNDATGYWKQVLMPTVINGTNVGWNDVVYISQLNKFFACAASGSNNREGIVSSDDGKQWWGGVIPTGFNPQQIAYAPSLGMIAVVSNSGPTTTARVLTSTDGGKNWTTRSIPTASVSPNCIAWSPTLSLFVIAGDSNTIHTSPDGITWTARTGPTSHNWRWAIWVGGTINKFFVTTYDFNVGPMVSSDGINWSIVTLAGGGLAVGGMIAYSPTLPMIIFVDDNNPGLCYSSDGVTWGRITTGIGSNKLHGVCWSAYLGLFIITTEGGPILTSPNGTTWTIQAGISNILWKRICASR